MEPFKLTRFTQAIRPIPRGKSDEAAFAEAAWHLARRSNASSPGLPVAYYRAQILGRSYPGERPWEPRWNRLASAVEFKDARVLELGCNMGLLSSFALLHGAEAACGVDHDPVILESARLVGLALGVHPELRQVDFDSRDDWDKRLQEWKPTVVFALNVVHWVADKEHLLAFLGTFSCVVFEGHDSAEIEIGRLRKVGFDDVFATQTTDRRRPLIVARRS